MINECIYLTVRDLGLCTDYARMMQKKEKEKWINSMDKYTTKKLISLGRVKEIVENSYIPCSFLGEYETDREKMKVYVDMNFDAVIDGYKSMKEALSECMAILHDEDD